MSQQNIKTTIISEGNTIIIPNPQPQTEPSLWDTLSGFFASNEVPTTKTASQPVCQPPVQLQIIEAVPVSIQIKPVEAVIQVVKIESIPIVEDTSSWTDYLSRQNIVSYCNSVKDQIKCLQGTDQRLSRRITQFKEQKLLSLGDVRVRSILMAFSSALMYKLISVNTVGLMRKTRNLGGSFIFMGYWFVPQLFNPFLRKPSLAQNIV